MKTFTTSLDKFNKITTIAVCVVIIGVIVFALTLTDELVNKQKALPVIPISLTLILLIAYAFRPNNYAVSDDKLLIHRMISDVKIMRSDIQSVEMIDESKVKNSIRTFGSGGFFGSDGKFWNSTLGSMTWYITRKENFVLVITNDEKKILLTPDEPEAFVTSLSS